MVKGGKASFAETTGSILKFQIIVHVKNMPCVFRGKMHACIQ